VPESATHLSLVQDIVDYIENRFSVLAGLIVLTDLPTSERADKPPRVGGYAPDVYAAEVPRTTVLIGEAKTADDLTTSHSRDQIAAFLKFLSYQQRGILVLAVPWQCVPAARIVLASARRSLNCDSSRVETVVLDGIVTPKVNS
jgi:hypothetical protein